MTYVPNMIHICPNNLPICQSVTKPQQTNEIYERSHKSLNSYSLVEYNKIFPNTNSWKTLQEESSWQERLWQLVFLKHFKQNSLRHLSVKQKEKIAYNNKKYVYKERKETTHGEIGELITTSSSSSYIYIYIYQR